MLVEPFSLTREFAQALDQADPLARFQQAFVPLEPGLVYLDGNSLGRLPQRTRDLLVEAIQQGWGQGLVRSWNQGWLDAPLRIGEKIARLVGAAPGQLAVCDSTSVNLYKLASTALDLRPTRRTILSDERNFPSDLYVLQGLAQARGLKLELVPGGEEDEDPSPAIIAAIDEGCALVCLSLVAYKSGCLYDAAAITQRAHQAGALVLWDLSHAAGAVPLDLDGWEVDFGVGCTYKYLNGGPGAPAFLYVRRALQEQGRSPIWAWFGQRQPFAFGLTYEPAPGVQHFLGGTPPILSLLAVEPGVDLLLEAGIPALRHKSLQQSEYLIRLCEAVLVPLGFRLCSPRAA